jgi:hypothetical protein
MESHEKRAYRRVEVTPLKSREGQLEILAYSTRSNGTEFAIPVLLIDVSEGGLQLLMPSLEQDQTEFMLEISTSKGRIFDEAKVRLIWSRCKGSYAECGFEFVERLMPMQQFEQHIRAANLRQLHCVLHPCVEVLI